ncbi:MAG: RNA-binding S4 domain-containing protein [Rhodocyclaceae bacterium]|nr:RNA-binding S4 domain-containing protein [Rhodocyclaceae bacterium]MBR4736727.1 RNA-binding S4 domain-containing protein [Rhodocyclaceae bacterium]MBR4876333.1 RNA-binding S4 domain-containing protein [Rhodocyclaceae bacterium]
MKTERFELRGEQIVLDQLLKAAGFADSGGQAHAMTVAGEVSVDGKTELRKRAKLRAGQVVCALGRCVRLFAGEDAGQ